jgi:hypothetical protein
MGAFSLGVVMGECSTSTMEGRSIMSKLKTGPKGALYLILGIAETYAGKTLLQGHDDWLRVKDICEAILGVESETADAKETGPESSREEVAGISTRGKSSNFSNTGFSGGSPERLAAAS